MVVIDPRWTATCGIADLHLALRPGSDVAVFAGLLLHLAETGACDDAWIEARTSGFQAAIEAARRSAPTAANAAALADVAPGELARFYDWFTATERTVTLYSQGVNQSSAGTDKVNAIINCHLATGEMPSPHAKGRFASDAPVCCGLPNGRNRRSRSSLRVYASDGLPSGSGPMAGGPMAPTMLLWIVNLTLRHSPEAGTAVW